MLSLLNNKEKENGAIVVEATVALTAFIFAILIILQLVNICYVQSKMAVALNSASKEMSQYSYLYTVLGLDKHMSGSGGESSEFMGSLSEVLNEISDGTSDISAELSGMFANTGDIAAGDSASEYIKDGIGMGLASQLVKKNLKSFEGDTADAFLHRNHVVGGLNFLYTSFLTNENQDEIDLVVTYKIQVLKLLNTEFQFNFVQRSQCKAWGKGVSIKNPSESATASSSIWDTGQLSRGKAIIANEKKYYSYTSSGDMYHAYNPANNEFVRIRTIDTNDKTYKNSNPPEKAIENALESSFSHMEGISDLGKQINVANSAGKDTVLNSDPNTRNYKLVVVVPENADLSTLNSAARAFEAEKALEGYNVSVEIKPGYGSPTPDEPTGDETDTGEDN